MSYLLTIIITVMILFLLSTSFFTLKKLEVYTEKDEAFSFGRNGIKIAKKAVSFLLIPLLMVSTFFITGLTSSNWQDKIIGLISDKPSPQELAEGAIVFEETCASCHGQNAQGEIGPNLTDEYFIHGVKPEEIEAVIINGVPAKGMAAWGGILPKEDIPKLVAYIISLRGTNPEKPKPPQGEKYAFSGGQWTLIPGEAKTDNVITVPDDLPNIALGGNLEKGQRLFNGVLGCAHCHGSNGRGHVDNRNVRGIKKRYGKNYLRMIDFAMLKGRKGTAMPTWEHLKTQQLVDLKSFLESIQQE